MSVSVRSCTTCGSVFSRVGLESGPDVDEYTTRQELALDQVRSDVQKLAHRVEYLEQVTGGPDIFQAHVQQLVHEVDLLLLRVAQRSDSLQGAEATSSRCARADQGEFSNATAPTATHEALDFNDVPPVGTVDNIDQRTHELITLIGIVQDVLGDLVEDVREIDCKFGRFVATTNMVEPVDSDGLADTLKELALRVNALELYVQKQEAKECYQSDTAPEHLSEQNTLHMGLSAATDMGSMAHHVVKTGPFSHFEQRLPHVQDSMEHRMVDIHEKMNLQLKALRSLPGSSLQLESTSERFSRNKGMFADAHKAAAPRRVARLIAHTPVSRPCSLSE